MYTHTHTHTHTHTQGFFPAACAVRYHPTTRLLGAFGPALDLAPRPLIWVGARGAAATAVASGVFVTAAWSGRKVHTSVYVVPTQVVGAAGYLRRWGLVG